MRTGKKNQALITGRIAYGHDGTDAYPFKVDSNSELKVQQREEFIFRPGSTVLTGVVESGTRSGAGTTTSGTVANSTYWSSWLTYQPYRSGQIDGLSTGGIVSGQLTIGVKCSAGTGTTKLTARIANTANTAAPTTMLALTGTITCTTAEIFKVYDIPYLQTDTVFNAIPFSVSVGANHQQASSSVIFRVMESSYIMGEFEPGT